MRVLFLVPWPVDAASTRLRVAQYFPSLRAQGIQPVLRPFMSEQFYGFVYKPGGLVRKSLHFAASCAWRLVDVVRAARADLVVVHREAFPFGATFIERAIARAGVPIVLDFDDAIYLPSGSHANSLVGRLKRPSKVADLLRLSHAVTVGNNHLRTYSLQYNPNVAVIPTPVDSEKFSPRPQAGPRQRVIIGWIGSTTTVRYLGAVVEPLKRLLQAYPNVEVHVVGGAHPVLEQLPVQYHTWSLERETALLHQFDIGIMPYPDNEWARGKCAHKALLYMSVGIPAVCSPVGMARELVAEGETGYLAASAADWFDKLAALVDSPALRAQMGARGRELVEAQFTVQALAPRLSAVLTAAARRQRLPAAIARSFPMPVRLAEPPAQRLVSP